MKETLRLFLVIVAYLGILYVLFSIGNGSFDFSLWKESVRSGFSIVGGFGTIFLIFSKWVLEW